MADGMHLGDEVEIITENFASLGAPHGAIGVIVGDWADGSDDVEVSDPETGQVVARFRAAESDIRPYSGPWNPREPRKHGILFGRGDDLGAPPGDAPAPPGSQFGGIPGSGPYVWGDNAPPPADGELTAEIPWELRQQPPSGPTFH